MNEFTKSYHILRGSLGRTIVYTTGHFLIAAACAMYFTGVAFDVAAADAIVEPLINGVWFYILDKMWNTK